MNLVKKSLLYLAIPLLFGLALSACATTGPKRPNYRTRRACVDKTGYACRKVCRKFSKKKKIGPGSAKCATYHWVIRP